MPRYKTERLVVMTTPEQRERWDKAAESMKMTTSEMVRRSVEAYISAMEKASGRKVT